MKTALLASAALLSYLISGSDVRAQVAVFDSPNFANTLRETVTATKELVQLQQQLVQLQQTYRMLTNPSDVTGMFPVLNAPAMQNSMPAASSIPGQIVGSSSVLSSAGQIFYNLNHVFSATGTDPQATLLNRSSISTANIQGIAAANLASIEQRQSNLNVMQAELQGATDIKQVTAINGRIAIESNAIQGQQAQAQNLAAMASAQAQADQQAALQSIRQGHEQAAAMFTGTLN